MTRRTHLAHGTSSRCGRGAAADTITHSTTDRIVTCLACLRLSRPARIEAAVALAAEPPPFVPSGPYASPRAASNLDAPGRRVIARSIAGDEPDERGRSSGFWELGCAAATARDEGVPLASPSNPDRYGKGKVSSGAAGRPHSISTQLRFIEWEMACDKACAYAVRVNRLLRLEPHHTKILVACRLGRHTRTRIVGRKGVRHDRAPFDIDVGIAGVIASGGPRLLRRQAARVLSEIEYRGNEILYSKGLVARGALLRGAVTRGAMVVAKARAEWDPTRRLKERCA